MPTYDGKTITTGTLYDNGTITVKVTIVPKIPFDGFYVGTFSIVSGKKKVKMLTKVFEDEGTDLGSFSITSGKKVTKIEVMTPETDPVVDVGSFSILSGAKRTVIVQG